MADELDPEELSRDELIEWQYARNKSEMDTILRVLQEVYLPARNEEEATHTPRTWEVVKMIRDHYPADIDSAMIFDALVKAGFRYISTGDEFLWLMRPAVTGPRLVA